MNVLILGANGQLGRFLQDTAPSTCHLLPAEIDEIDIGSVGELPRAIAGFNADAIINAAAFTAVARAESEPKTALHRESSRLTIKPTTYTKK